MKQHKKKSVFGILLGVVLLLVIVGALLHYFLGYEVHQNVKYGEKDANVMNIYIPREAYNRESNGCVLFIHGGSWSGGDKAEETARCRLLASRGYITATMNYTLWSEEIADTYSVFDVLDEIDAALSTIQSFAAERGIVIDKAATAGYSAGAHLSMLYSFSRADTAPMEIVFTANMAGPANISPAVWGEDMTIRVARRLTGMELTPELLDTKEATELLASISPVSYIDQNTPPSIIMHGGKDPVVPFANADSLITKFIENAVPYDFIYLKDSDHALWQNPLKHVTYCKTILAYCEQYFEEPAKKS